MRRRPEALEPLLATVRDCDRLVLLGDTLELRHGPLREVLDVAEPVLRELGQALGVAVKALSSTATNGANGAAAETPGLDVDRLEVAVLDRTRPRRAFRRIAGQALADLLPAAPAEVEAGDSKPAESGDGDAKPDES